MVHVVRVVVLFVALVVLVGVFHLAIGHWPFAMTVAAFLLWWFVGFLFGHATRTWRLAWRTFVVATSVALLAVVMIGLIVDRNTYLREAPIFTISLVTLLAEVTTLPMVWLGVRAGTWTAARSSRRWTVRAAVVAVIACSVWRGYLYERNLGLVGYETADRVEAFDRLVDTLDSQYAHWSYSPIQHDALVARWRPRVIAASRTCNANPCLPYLEAIRDMLAELRDIHTGLGSRVFAMPARPPIRTALVDGELTIVEGAQRGAVIRRIDGRTSTEAMAAVPAWQVAYSNDLTVRELRAVHALNGVAGSKVTLDLDDGTRVVLTRELLPQGPDLDAHVVEPGVLVVGIHGLRNAGIVEMFDHALETNSPRALIFDLRANRGGNSGIGNAIVGRLIDHATKFGVLCTDHPHPRQYWVTGCGDLVVDPRGLTFKGRVAVLLDAGVVSSGEWLAAALCDTGRAKCFGRTTSGGSGNPVMFGLPGGVVRYSTSNAKRLDGSPFERGGVPPHQVVTWHRADVIAGRDPDMQAALAYLH